MIPIGLFATSGYVSKRVPFFFWEKRDLFFCKKRYGMLFSLFSNEIFLVKIKYDFLYLYEFFNRNFFRIYYEWNKYVENDE